MLTKIGDSYSPFQELIYCIKVRGAHLGSCVYVCVCIHKPGPLVSGLLNQDQVACHIPLSRLSLTGSGPWQARALLWKQVLQSSPKRFFKKPKNKNFPLRAGKHYFFKVLLNRRPCKAHKTREHLVNGVSFTRSPAPGTWLLFPLV